MTATSLHPLVGLKVVTVLLVRRMLLTNAGAVTLKKLKKLGTFSRPLTIVLGFFVRRIFLIKIIVKVVTTTTFRTKLEISLVKNLLTNAQNMMNIVLVTTTGTQGILNKAVKSPLIAMK